MSENSNAFVMNEPDDTFSDESLFAELSKEAEKSIERDPLLLAVDRRPGWAIEYRGELTLREMQQIHKRCIIKGSGPKGQEQVNVARFSAIVCASMETQLVKVNPATGDILRRLEDTDGDPAGITSEQFLKAFTPGGGMDSVQALIAFMGESGVTAHGGAVLRWQGLEDEAEQLNPTNG